jgi:hypothetical protein
MPRGTIPPEAQAVVPWPVDRGEVVRERRGIDEIDGADGIDGIDGIDEADEADEADGIDEVDEIDGADGIDEIEIEIEIDAQRW